MLALDEGGYSGKNSGTPGN